MTAMTAENKDIDKSKEEGDYSSETSEDVEKISRNKTEIQLKRSDTTKKQILQLDHTL
jgi:hypothetical protein